ncbi:MAG: carboxypeptidase-like regulatory domain-containing protein, partial [Pyrinomonadaceae bacterium]
MPKAVVTVKNPTTTRKVTTSEDGEYSLSVPQGIYKVAVDGSALGFDVIYRSDVKLDTSSAHLNLTVFPKYTVHMAYAGGPHKDLDHAASRTLSFSFEEVP